MLKKPMTYKEAGVDIAKAEQALGNLKAKIAATHTPEVLSGVGMFGGFFDISALGMKEPVLVSSTDGVGTKLKVAMLANRHETVGQDLVHHCINDIAVCGARPLFFLDYFACGTLESGVYEAVVGGIAAACKNSGVALVGGETAEMPDFYQPGDYDLCGTIVGAVEKSAILDGSRIRPGDTLIGLSGNGLHTNGYTLARRVLLTEFGIHDNVPELQSTIADELLRIHPNYFPLISEMRSLADVHGLAHITGGGIAKNTARLLRPGLDLDINWKAWPEPPVFDLIRRRGNVPEDDMRLSFNLGIGLVAVVDRKDGDMLLERGQFKGFNVYAIGEVVATT